MENVTRGRESLLAKSQNRTEQNRIYFAKITQGDIAKTGHTATYIYTVIQLVTIQKYNKYKPCLIYLESLTNKGP